MLDKRENKEYNLISLKINVILRSFKIMEKKVKVGIIGCGGIANGKHMPALKAVDACEMVAFCDIIVERAQAAAEKFGVEGAKVYADYIFRMF